MLLRDMKLDLNIFSSSSNFKLNLIKTNFNSENIFESTLIHLTEPFDNTELYIVGTTNQSDLLANRTKNYTKKRIEMNLYQLERDLKYWTSKIS